jgi:hypothetical protein
MANTGRKLVLTLKEVQNPGSIPTGETKTNLSSDADYIAPYEDLDDCPVVYTLDCPSVEYSMNDDDTTLYYEFSLPNSVVDNPLLAKIRVTLNTGPEDDFLLPNSTPNYFVGEFAGLNPLLVPYSIIITYLDSEDTVLQTCEFA